ncbi:MAG: glycosyltransferase, partial [Planctomycetaceae bacterium]|nr:glycosyltransferase [Planctomycetaceae bacterium]
FDRFAGDKYTCPWLNEFRGELALPPVQHPLRSWWHSPLKVLGMFPEWFAPQQPDWPAQGVQLGFPLHDVPESSVVSDDVHDFIAQDQPPLVFMATSAQRFGHDFFAAAVQACTRLQRCGLLLTAFAEQIPANLPSHVRHAPFVPLSWLLPRAAAIVHNGGIGALSQAMLAGIPQLMSPLAFDQFDNTARAVRLGVGYELAARKFSAQLASSLAKLLSDPQVRGCCESVRRRFAQEDALARACREIEHAPLSPTICQSIVTK